MCAMRLLRMLVVLVAFLSCSQGFSQTLREQYDRLIEEYESAMEAWHQQYDAAETEDELIPRYREWPGWKFAPKYVELAESAGKDSAGFDCLERVLELGWSVDATDRELLPHYEKSLELLLRNHSDKDLRSLCRKAGMTNGSENFLKTLADQKENPELRAEATLCLGRLLARKWLASLPDAWPNPPGKTSVDKYLIARCQEGLRNFLGERAEQAVYEEAVKYLTLVSEEFGDVLTIDKKKTLGEVAKAELYELQHLSPGKTAPDIEGSDLLGEQMKLSEHRGKVVLLVFWASWCGPCVGDIPHEKELAEHFEGRPFVIVGVNADNTLEEASEAVRKYEVPWKSFWNGEGGPEGPISEAWNIHGWPTVYVLDHTGVIKHKDLRRDSLDEPLEKLIAAAEEAKQKP